MNWLIERNKKGLPVRLWWSPLSEKELADTKRQEAEQNALAVKNGLPMPSMRIWAQHTRKQAKILLVIFMFASCSHPQIDTREFRHELDGLTESAIQLGANIGARIEHEHPNAYDDAQIRELALIEYHHIRKNTKIDSMPIPIRGKKS